MQSLTAQTPKNTPMSLGFKGLCGAAIGLLGGLAALSSPVDAGQSTHSKNLPTSADTLQSRVFDEVLKDLNKTYFTLTVENDLFGAGTDRNYTNGIRLGWFKVGQKPPGVTDTLEDILPFLTINDATSVSYSIGHNLYTPDAVDSAAQDPTDRPWAAFLYGSMSMVTLEENHVDEFELTLGVVGPLAFGKEIQTEWHKLINSRKPQGWGNQLDNEPGIILSWQRRWPEIIGTEIGNTYLSFGSHTGATVGNIYTYANAGGTLKWSLTGKSWGDKPLGVKPSIPGSGYFRTKPELGVDLFIGVEGRAVAQNIFLDGNTFTNSHSVDKKHFVADLSGGLSLSYGPARLSYTLAYRTREFDGQEDPEVFGAVSLGYNF